MSIQFGLAMSGGINWNWYLAYSIDDSISAITRLGETRFHRHDYSQGADMDYLLFPLARGVEYSIADDEVPWGTERMASGVTLNGFYRPFVGGQQRRFMVGVPYLNWKDFAAKL